MGNCTKERISCQGRSEVKKLEEKEGLPFREVLSVDRICEVLKRHAVEYRERIYSPYVTLWAFLSQVTARDGSCEDAVVRVAAHHRLNTGRTCSLETTSYCAARRRLPTEVYSDLAQQTGEKLEEQAPEEWLWHGRHVHIVDGSTLTMADTKANQKAFPQSTNQKPGLGFPLARIVVLLSLSTGAVLDAAIRGSKGKKTGEITLFRELWSSFNPGDIALGDRLYDSYPDIARLKQERQVDVVFGMKQSRQRDFRLGRKLGKNDHIVVWQRPKFDKARIDRDTWEGLPASMEMRELSVKVRRKGHRTRTITVVTTLLDAEKYSAQDIMELFRQRWHCELDIRSIKTVMGMCHLRSKSPEMAQREFWCYLLAYNLIRVRMAQAGAVHGVLPRRLSFTTAKKTIETFSPLIAAANSAKAGELVQEMIKHIASRRVGNRPGRSEPRAVKRRQNKNPYLTVPRPQARKQLTT